MTATARAYGEALYELARDEQVSGEILEQLQTAVRLTRENPAYLRLLSLPSLPKEERCGLLDESFRGCAQPYLLNFMKLLVEQGIIRQLAGCEEAYRRRYDADNGILEVTAVTAVLLTDELHRKLQAMLERRTGKTIRLKTRVDPAVLGGVRLELDGKRLDGTIQSRLEAIQAALRGTIL